MFLDLNSERCRYTIFKVQTSISKLRQTDSSLAKVFENKKGVAAILLTRRNKLYHRKLTRVSENEFSDDSVR